MADQTIKIDQGMTETPVPVRPSGCGWFLLTASAVTIAFMTMGIAGAAFQSNDLKSQELDIRRQELDLQQRQHALDSVRFEYVRKNMHEHKK